MYGSYSQKLGSYGYVQPMLSYCFTQASESQIYLDLVLLVMICKLNLQIKIKKRNIEFNIIIYTHLSKQL